MALTKKDVEDYISIELGGGDITVDLNDTDYAHIITAALRALSTYKPLERLGLVHVSSGVQKYVLDAGTYGRNVIQVMRTLPTSPLYSYWPLPDPYVISMPLYHVGDYALSLTKWKEAEYLYGGDFNWTFDKETGILLIKPPPVEGCNYAYRYLDNYRLEDVGAREQWLLDFALASAKRIVGSKWRKFRNFPGNENQVELYTEIYDEGTEDRTALLESLERAGSGAVPPIPAYRRG